ncbi:MAG: peroxiredoxin [Nitrososphaerales archaeon]
MASIDNEANPTVLEGQTAPDFKLQSDDGKTYSLQKFKGKKRVVLYFYPEDDTPGCTKEACSFRDSLSRLSGLGVQILGVSHNDLNDHSGFRAKYGLNFPLLSDPENIVSTEYGVYKMKNLYGRKFMGVERSTFIIGKDGKVEKIYRRVKVDGHVDDVINCLTKS